METILAKLREDIELRNYSEATAKHYERVCGYYSVFLGDMRVEDAGEEQLRAWSLHLSRVQGRAPATVDNYLACVCFMYEVTPDRAINRRQVPFMKLPKKLPTVFTRGEIEAAIDAAASVRDAAIIALAYGSGLRASEVCSVRVRDVDSASMRLRVEDGKGQKERMTLLSDRALALLRERYAADLAGRAGARRGDRTFHSLRASNACHLLEGGTDLMTIKELMGHASISSTTKYLCVANTSAAVVSPLDA